LISLNSFLTSFHISLLVIGDYILPPPGTCRT